MILEDAAKQFALPSMTCPVTGKSVPVTKTGCDCGLGAPWGLFCGAACLVGDLVSLWYNLMCDTRRYDFHPSRHCFAALASTRVLTVGVLERATLSSDLRCSFFFLFFDCFVVDDGGRRYRCRRLANGATRSCGHQYSMELLLCVLLCFGGKCTLALVLFGVIVVPFCKVGVAFSGSTEVGRVILLKRITDKISMTSTLFQEEHRARDGSRNFHGKIYSPVEDTPAVSRSLAHRPPVHP